MGLGEGSNNMETIVIRNIYGKEIFSHTCENNTIKKTVLAANLSVADLSVAYLSRADLSGANLSGADLSGANLSGADLSVAYLSGANLSMANLSGANLSGANLSRANLSRANLEGVNFNENTSMFLPQCPDGAFIGWKKAKDKIVKIEICEDSKRSSATSLKCRCSKAIVLEIQEYDGTHSTVNEVASDYNENFIYKIGEVVEVSDFNENRWYECSIGIHFFISREMAVKYC